MTRRLFLTADSVGGVWQYATELAGTLTGRGYHITIALLGPAPSEAQRRRVCDGVTLLETSLPLDWLAKDAATVIETGQALARLSRAHGADIVQLNQPALAADAAFGVPLVAVAHSCVGTWWQTMRGTAPEPQDLAWQTALTRQGLAAAAAVVTPTRAFGASLQRRYALSEAPEAVHNGRAPIARRSGVLHHFAFTAGRLWDEGKNVATLDRAAARLAIPFKAAGATSGPGGAVIRLEHLQVLGALEEDGIARCLSARPVFASSARYEPFGLAVLEAALASCPLVLADTETFRELWDGVATFVDPEDDAGFADAIAAIVGDDPARCERGDGARQRADEYSPDRMGTAMDALYSRLIAHAGRRVAA